MAKNLRLRSFHDFMAKVSARIFYESLLNREIIFILSVDPIFNMDTKCTIWFNKYFVAMKTEMLSILK